MFKSFSWILILSLSILTGCGGSNLDEENKSNAIKDAPETSKLKREINKEKEDLHQKVLSFSIEGKSSKGVRQWQLQGDSAEIVGDKIYLSELEAIAYGDKTVVNLTSDSGIYRKGMREVELIGNVEVISDDGTVLTTEQAKWMQDTKEIFSDTYVYINREGLKASGKGGIADPGNKRAVLKEDVMVNLEPTTDIMCDGPLEIEYNDNMAVFYRNVKVKDKDGKLFSDKLTVKFDPDTQKIDKVIAEGNVKIKKGNSYTMSQKAVYTDGTRSAKLVGRPRVIIDPSEVSDFEDFGGFSDR